MRLSLYALAICASVGQLTWTQTSAQAATYQNYSQAWHAAQNAQRPLLVIFNSNQQTGKAITENDLQADSQIKNQLGNYVVAVIDTTTETGRKDYELFDSASQPRIVVIDKQQSKQIFRSSDALSNDKLASVLTQYQSGDAPTASPATAVKMNLPTAYPQTQTTYSSCPSCQNQRYYRYSR